jgi:hypothetical protein
MNFETCFRSSRRNAKNEKWRLPVRRLLVQYHRRGLHGLETTGHLAGVRNTVTVIEIAGTTGRLHDMSAYLLCTSCFPRFCTDPWQ